MKEEKSKLSSEIPKLRDATGKIESGKDLLKQELFQLTNKIKDQKLDGVDPKQVQETVAAFKDLEGKIVQKRKEFDALSLPKLQDQNKKLDKDLKKHYGDSVKQTLDKTPAECQGIDK